MRKAVRTGLGLWVLVVLAASPAFAADWPTWRCDAARSAASPQELPAQLHLQWSRQLPATLLAWPNEARLHFDAGYQPAVAGQAMFVGSPNDGSVRAYDARTGAERWTFFTEGPVRFAPAVWQGKLYAASDDGWLYCLSAADGRLLFKVRGAPEDRPDRRHLGNNRLVSFWPVRGGPVVADRTVYFAAGLWPTLGVFVVAAEAETGKVVWRNGELALIDDVRLDHNKLGQSGLSPQGYLAVRGDTLLVPNGRSLPAGLDRRTGKLLHYVQGYRNGDCRVTTEGDFAFVGDAGVTDLRTGREVGSRWAAAGKEAPNEFVLEKFHLFEGPMFPYKTMPGCSARSAFGDSIAYGLEQGTFFAYDLARPAVSEYDQEFVGQKFKPWRWDAPLLWKLASEDAPRKPAGAAIIKAGGRLYGHWQERLAAVELPAAAGASPRIVWTTPLTGTPWELLAADDRLFVVTREGAIHCLGAGRPEKQTVLASLPENRGSPPAQDAWPAKAKEMLRQSGVTEGYCLVLGAGTGRLVDEVLSQSRLQVIVIDPDKQKVDSLRAKLASAGHYGRRAETVVGRPLEFSFPPYLASLVVSEDPPAAGFTEKAPPAALDVLRPYGGTLCLGVPAAEHEAIVRWAASSAVENLKVERAGDYSLVRRVGPLPGSAAWTHECADAARTYFSRDRRVEPPLGILWYGDGPGHGFWKYKDYETGVKPQVAGGRLFACMMEHAELTAYDAYTGRLLWTKKVDPYTRYASLPEAVYVAYGDRCRVLDPATGEERAAFAYDIGGGRQPFVSDIRVADGVIVIAAAPQKKSREFDKGYWNSATLVTLDRESGKVLWRREAEHRFNNCALAIGRGRVFCADSVAADEAGKAQRRGEAPPAFPSNILALDARTGQVLWSYKKMVPTALCHNDDWLAWCEPLDLLLTGKQNQAVALSAADGKEAWQAKLGGSPWIVRGDSFVAQWGQAFDARSGKPAGKAVPRMHHGCNYMVGGERMLFLRECSATLIDWQTGAKHAMFAVRSGCSNSLVAADGLLSVPCFSVGCVCNYPMQTSFAMMRMPEVAGWAVKIPATQAVRREDLTKAVPPAPGH